MSKTVITLTAITDLLFDRFAAHKILVIAPLRVARDTWPAEIEKWDHLHSLTYSVAIGTEQERRKALMAKADIYLINRENVHWLVSKSNLPFDFDMVVIDEFYKVPLQAAIYVEIERRAIGRAAGDWSDFLLVAVSEEEYPDKAVLNLTNRRRLAAELAEIQANMPRIMALKAGLVKPLRCEECNYCRSTRKLSSVIQYSE